MGRRESISEHSRGRRRLLRGGGSMLLLAGCATRVETTGTYNPPLAAPLGTSGGGSTRPGDVLVTDFEVDWRTIELDQGIRARLQRQMQSGDTSQDQEAMAAEVKSAIAETLVERIRAMGLQAVRATTETRPRPGDLVVSGQIVKVDSGNATRRTLIGFGAGKSEVFADVQLYQETTGERTILLQTYDASANSGRAPGLGMGAASAAAGETAVAVAGAAIGTASRARSGVAKDGEHLAGRVARNLGQYFSQQGWIDPSKVPSIVS